MTVTEWAPGRLAPSARKPQAGTTARRWSWPHYLAVVGFPILLWEAWTIVAWVADGPTQVTEFRAHGSVNWWAAKTFEGLAILASVLVIGYLVRGCIRARRFLTFDVMFCMAGATIFWSDLGDNFFQPTILMSSNFVNLTNPCGHMPLVVNPDCGRVPDAILFFWLVETFIVLGCAVAVGAGVRRARLRWPAISTAKLIGLVLLAGVVLEVAIEGPAVALGLWTYTAGPLSMHLGGKGLKYPLLEIVAGGLWFLCLVAMRIFKDDKGRTVVERGLEHHTPRAQKAITLLALYSFVQLVSWGPGSLPMIVSGPYQGAWPKVPGYLLNDACDAPGVGNTRYGTCPGDPGARMPGRHSLPGESP